MGGCFSEDKREVNNDENRWSREMGSQSDCEYFSFLTNRPIFVCGECMNSSGHVPRRMYVTPKGETSNELENYGFIPNLAITKISLFLPLKDLPSFYLSCKLFYHCSNTNFQWRSRYQSILGRKSKYTIPTNNHDVEVNWKKYFFIRFHRRYSDDSFKEKFIDIANQQVIKYDTFKSRRIGLKCILLGPLGVGKTSLFHRIWRDRFITHYVTTIAMDFLSKIYSRKLQTKKDDDEETQNVYNLQFWDPVGLRTTSIFYRGANIVLLCFAINNRRSFEDEGDEGFRRYIEEIKEKVYPSVKPLAILVGLKLDLEDQRQVTSEEAMEYVEKNKEVIHAYVELSSKTRKNVNALLSIILDIMIQRVEHILQSSKQDK